MRWLVTEHDETTDGLTRRVVVKRDEPGWLALKLANSGNTHLLPTYNRARFKPR